MMSFESIWKICRLRTLMGTLMGAIMACAILFYLPLGAAAQGAGDLPLTSGTHYLTLLRTDGPEIDYAISIPDNYSASTPVPLILALHFGGNPSGAGASILQILIGPALSELGAIIIAPDSVGGNWTTLQNENAVSALLDTIIANYAIDETKVAVSGFSMGGAGSWHIAEKFPERFSAVIPVAGRPPASAAGWQLPVFAIHSRNDQVAPFSPTEERIAELQNMGVDATLIALDGITHYQTNRFQPALRDAVPWLGEIWQ
jgi:predicted peptidase